MILEPKANARHRALFSLAGLSVGDALGEQFFGPSGKTLARIEDRQLPPAPWGAARCLAGSFEEAFWTTVFGLGDRDTTCAMVGGIVALTCREIPEGWLAAREPLPPGFST